MAMPGVSDWLLMIRDVIVDHMNQRSWAHAFTENGFGEGQANVSKYIRSHLPSDAVLPVPDTLPSIESLRRVFPKTRTTLDVQYFRTLLGAPSANALPSPPVVVAKALPMVPYRAPVAVPKFETPFTASLSKPAVPLMPKVSKAPAPVVAKSKHLAASLLVQELAKGPLPWLPPPPKAR